MVPAITASQGDSMVWFPPNVPCFAPW
jgi:hypothetical protein